MDCFDVSKDEDGKVLAWVTDNNSNGKYEMSIGSPNKIFVYNGSFLFSKLENLTSITGLQFIDTSKVTTMSSMFSGCSSLTTIDLSNFNTSNLTSTSEMFNGCRKLNKILVSNSFVVSSVASSDHMFFQCVNLVGGSGTIYNSSYIDKTYARVDGGSSNPGYFTRK